MIDVKGLGAFHGLAATCKDTPVGQVVLIRTLPFRDIHPCAEVRVSLKSAGVLCL